MQFRLGVESRGTLEHQCLVMVFPVGAHKQVGECRVRLVGARFGQGHLEDRHQFQLDHIARQIAQLNLSKLDIVFRADPHRAERLQVGPGGFKEYAVGVVGAVVARCRIRCRVSADRVD